MHALAAPYSSRAIDPRADGATRTVHVDAAGVTIERSLGGVHMRVGVPIGSYRGLVLAVREASETATLTLRHADHELNVALGHGNAMALARQAKAWGELLGQPIAIEVASVTMRLAIGRRTARGVSPRRSRFARRRKIGVATLPRVAG